MLNEWDLKELFIHIIEEKRNPYNKLSYSLNIKVQEKLLERLFVRCYRIRLDKT